MKSFYTANCILRATTFLGLWVGFRLRKARKMIDARLLGSGFGGDFLPCAAPRSRMYMYVVATFQLAITTIKRQLHHV